MYWSLSIQNPDWVSPLDVFAEDEACESSGPKASSRCGRRGPLTEDRVGTDEPVESDDEDILMDLPTDEGIGDRYGLVEIPGGIGIDSCASDNVMHRDMLPGYVV